MVIVSLIIAAALGLFVVWRIRYGYPPVGYPQTLCYHKISRRFCFEGTWITPERFLRQIDYLESKGYRFVDEDAYIRALERPSAENARKILISFDDGYREVHSLVVDHLAKRGIPVVVYLVTDFVGKENLWDLSLGRRAFQHISWPEAKELVRRGVGIGSHGATHVDLRRVSEGRLEREIVDSKAAIERNLGIEVKTFSYPFGRYNRRVKGAVEAAGYRAAFSLYPPHPNRRIDKFALRRNGVYIIDNNRSLRWKLERNPIYWLEEMKCRSINGVSVVTPIIKRFFARRGR